MRVNEFLLALLLGEIGRDAPLPRLRHAGDQRPVDLSRRARAEGFCQGRRREPRLGDEQAARGVLVEPMNEARALAVSVAQRLEHAVDMAHGAGAALHREPHRLVEHQHVGVFVERERLEERAIFLRRRRIIARLRRIKAQRRNTHCLSGFQPVLWLRALAVDAHLAFTDDALDVGEAQAWKARLEEAIDPHAGFVRADRHVLHAASPLPLRSRNGVSRTWKLIATHS